MHSMVSCSSSHSILSDFRSTRLGMIAAFVFAASFGMAGCAGTGSVASSHHGMEHAGMRHGEEVARSDDRMASLESLYWARLDSAKMRFNDNDVMFMVMMIPHHSQALIMSALAEPNGASPEVRTLASRIINAQKDEIRTMLTWLKDRGQPYPEVLIDGLVMTVTMNEGTAAAAKGDDGVAHGMDHEKMDHAASGHDMDHGDEHGEHGGHDMEHGDDHSEHDMGDGDVDHDMDHGDEHGEHGGHDMGHGSHGSHDIMTMDHSTMVGMLTQAQLVELSQARGREFDRLFLKYMIQHHNGAVVMVTDLFAADGAVQHESTYKIASDIQVDQRTEIARMQLMLDRVEAELSGTH
jgi:uncharacterized protein (DUF305 family)